MFLIAPLTFDNRMFVGHGRVGFAESSTFTCFEKDVPHDL
jgi:hypothetical protein